MDGLRQSDGGSAITGYDVEYREGTTGNWSDWPHTGTGNAATIARLVNGTAYQVQVAAINNVGTGPHTAPQSATPLAGSPAQVDYFAYAAVNTVSATVIWDAPAPGDSAVVGYDIRYRRIATPAGGWVTARVNADILEYQITGLAAGTIYEGQARARNSQGVGPWSSALGFETNSALFRNAPPGNLRAENIAQSKTRLGVALDWDLVLDATGYQVRVTSPGNQRSSQQIVEASENRLALTYELAATDTGGTLIFSVRGKRVANSETTYTPVGARRAALLLRRVDRPGKPGAGRGASRQPRGVPGRHGHARIAEHRHYRRVGGCRDLNRTHRAFWTFWRSCRP